MATAPENFLGERDYQSVALTHFFVDVLNGSRTLLVALLAVSLGLTNAQVGLALVIYNLGNALTQPFFGGAADRIGPRWLVIFGLAWMIGFYAIAAVASDWVALLAITVAGLGSGAFHPSGTMVASHANVTSRTQATSVFFMAGQMGLLVGPIATGLLLDHFGQTAFLALPLLALTALAGSWRSISRDGHDYGAEAPHEGNGLSRASLKDIPRSSMPQVLALAGIIICTGTTSTAVVNYAPVLFADAGIPSGQIGLMVGLIALGMLLGGVTAGTLADRTNGRVVVIVSMLLAIVPVYAYVATDGLLRLVFLTLAGFFIGMPHSILVLAGQNLLPRFRGTASGVVLGYTFFAGSLGTLLVGLAADQVGLDRALEVLAVLPLIAALIALVAFDRQKRAGA